MSRYYSDSEDDYAVRGPRANSVRGSGWQSPLPTSTNMTSPLPEPSMTRIVVDSPFGTKKYDYNIDKSQRGRLVITARRRQNSSGDNRSSSKKNQVAVQTFTIPTDADVDRLQSHMERDTNRLIIEIPRQHRRGSRGQHSSYVKPNTSSTRLLRSPDVERMLTSPTGGPQLVRDEMRSNRRNSSGSRKLEYRFDCHGYRADELEVSVQGRDLIVQGKTNTSTSSDPAQQRVSKKFSRKIALPHTVDLSKVVSYLEHGELRIEAPLKHGAYQTDEEIIIPGPPPPTTSNRATAALISNLEKNRVRSPTTSNRATAALISSVENRVRSPSPANRTHYRRNEHYTRRRDYDRSNHRGMASPVQRVRSAEDRRYPLYVPPRDLDGDGGDEDDSKERENRRQRTSVYGRSTVDRKANERPRSLYTPTNLVTSGRTSVMSHRMNYPSDEENNLKF